MNRKAISPLLSTIFLIILAIGVGIIVMNWGRAQLEAGAKCAVDTQIRLVRLNQEPQICYSGTGEQGIIKFIVENGVHVDVAALNVRVIGSKIYELTLRESGIEKGYTLQKVVPYNFQEFGSIKQIKITPRIVVYEGEPSLLCAEQAIIIESIKPC